MGLCLPRKRRSTSVARRPKVWSVASTTYQSRSTDSGFALIVFIESALEHSNPRSARHFNEREYYRTRPQLTSNFRDRVDHLTDVTNNDANQWLNFDTTLTGTWILTETHGQSSTI